MTKKLEQRMMKANQRIKYIKQFAKNMGYEAWEDDYTSWKNNRPCHSIELAGKQDSEGNPYCWAWYTDTWEEM